MPLKIVRNDITKMQTDAIVNTANEFVNVGPGCDYAIYQAAGFDELLAYRREHVGQVPEGESFITPGFALPCRYIIHAVSPLFINGESGEEEKLRSCYRKSLALASEYQLHSIAFPLIATGGFGYPQEEGMRIAVDEINSFLINHEMLVYLVVFGRKATNLGRHLYADLESYIDQRYVDVKKQEEYCDGYRSTRKAKESVFATCQRIERPSIKREDDFLEGAYDMELSAPMMEPEFDDFYESALKERIDHLSDTFSEYLIYLIDSKGMSYPEVYKRAIVDKKVFSKIKNNPYAHPKKITAMCLCIGAKLNMDQTKDLLSRAGYALSPCDITDIIFSFFIEHHIYDMIELDIQLEEHGVPCLIS